VLAPPAMRIGVRYFIFGKKGVLLLQHADDARVRLVHVHAGELTRLFREPRLVVHGSIHVQTVFNADLVVLLSVARCGVHRAGAGLEGNVFSENYPGVPIDERMARLQSFKASRP